MNFAKTCVYSDFSQNSEQADTMTTKCIVCLKSVFQMELVRDERGPYHDKCYKCTHCKTKLQFGKYSEIEGKLYCVLHTPSSLTPPIRQEPQVELVFTSTPTPTIAPPQRTTMPPPQPTPQPLVNISPILPIPPRQKRLPPLPAAKYPDLNFPFGKIVPAFLFSVSL